MPDVSCDFPSETLFPPGVTLVTCVAEDGAGNRSVCSFEVRVVCPAQLPGDCNQDRTVDISDAVCILKRLFDSSDPFSCGGSIEDPGNVALLDWNGDGGVDISDGVGSLLWLFLDGQAHVLGRECAAMPGCPLICL